MRHEKTEKKTPVFTTSLEQLWSNPEGCSLGVTIPNLKKKLAHVKVCHWFNTNNNVREPGLLVWVGGCKVENVYINVRFCALFIKIREVCIKKPQIPVTSSLHMAYLLHGSYTKDMLTHAKYMQYLRSDNLLRKLSKTNQFVEETLQN